MTVQAAGVRSLLRSPSRSASARRCRSIEQTGREALAEMRRLVGVLRRPEEAPALAPQPSLEHVDKLVAQAREAGLPVELRVEGDPVQLPAGVDLTAYRLVQEGLTNAIKHAHARARRGRRSLPRRARRADGQSDDGSGDGRRRERRARPRRHARASVRVRRRARRGAAARRAATELHATLPIA